MSVSQDLISRIRAILRGRPARHTPLPRSRDACQASSRQHRGTTAWGGCRAVAGASRCSRLASRRSPARGLPTRHDTRSDRRATDARPSALRQPVRRGRERRHAGRPAEDDPGRAGRRRRPGTTITLAARRLPRAAAHRRRRHARPRRSRSRAPRPGMDRAGRYRRDALRHRPDLQHRPHLTTPSRLHDRRPGAAPRHAVPDGARARSTRSSTASQDQVEDGRLIYIGAATTVARHHRASRSTTCSSRRGRRVRAAAQQRARQHDQRLGDPVLRDVRQGRRGRTAPSSTTARASTSARARSPPTSRCTRTTPSSRNVVARNVIRTFGSECFNVKENAYDNVFEDDVCSDNTEPRRLDGSNVELRGYAQPDPRLAPGRLARLRARDLVRQPAYDKGGNSVQRDELLGDNWGGAPHRERRTVQALFCGDSFGPATILEGRSPWIRRRRALAHDPRALSAVRIAGVSASARRSPLMWLSSA